MTLADLDMDPELQHLEIRGAELPRHRVSVTLPPFASLPHVLELSSVWGGRVPAVRSKE